MNKKEIGFWKITAFIITMLLTPFFLPFVVLGGLQAFLKEFKRSMMDDWNTTYYTLCRIIVNFRVKED